MFMNMIIHFQMEDVAEAPAANHVSCVGAPDELLPVHVPCTTCTIIASNQLKLIRYFFLTFTIGYLSLFIFLS